MVMVDVDDELYDRIKPILLDKKVEYPNLKNFVNKAIKALIEKEVE